MQLVDRARTAAAARSPTTNIQHDLAPAQQRLGQVPRPSPPAFSIAHQKMDAGEVFGRIALTPYGTCGVARLFTDPRHLGEIVARFRDRVRT
jgi:hypothetical protein